MKASDLRDKSVDELKEELLKVRKQQFKYRIQQSTGQLGQTHMIRSARRDVARIKTVLAQKAGEN